MLTPATAIYAALCALIFIVLGFNVGRVRGKTKVSLNDGGNLELAVAIRQHANFTESVPLALILLALLELNGSAKTLVHSLGAVLVIARVIHPFGLDPNNGQKPARGIGAGATFLVILISALVLLWQAFVR